VSDAALKHGPLFAIESIKAPPPKIGGFLRQRPREKKPRTWQRRIYAGALLLVGTSGVLQMRRGAFVRTINAEGDVIADARDESLGLIINIGDKVIACGKGDDSICMLEVTRIEPGGAEKLSVRLLAGIAENGNVHVLNAKGLGK
jgi:hypothetical protein